MRHAAHAAREHHATRLAEKAEAARRCPNDHLAGAGEERRPAWRQGGGFARVESGGEGAGHASLVAETYAARRAREGRERRESLASSGSPASSGGRSSSPRGPVGACGGGGGGGTYLPCGGTRLRSPPTTSSEEPAVWPPPLSLSRSPLSRSPLLLPRSSTLSPPRSPLVVPSTRERLTAWSARDAQHPQGAPR